nr:hypothetical protein [uncultured Lichenicoccus sp.]
MPTVIDSLVMELGLSAEGFTSGMDKAQEGLRNFAAEAEAARQKLRTALGMSGAEFDGLWKKAEQSAGATNRATKSTSDQATRSAKEMNAQGSVAAGFFSKLKLEALGLFAALMGGKGLEAALASSSTEMRNLGFAAQNAQLDPGAIDAFSMAVGRLSGNAAGAQQALVTLRQATTRSALPGQSGAYAGARVYRRQHQRRSADDHRIRPVNTACCDVRS